MYLISVNIGKKEPIQYAQKSGYTGIFKRADAGPVQVTELGLEGDANIDVKNHGGFEQAVYAYGEPDYAWWSTELGRTLEPGTFGENLTIAGLESASLSAGDRLQVGPVLLQVTYPRIPCSTLGARMSDMGFVKRFRFAERPGAYFRVLRTGPVQAGDPVTLEPYQGETVTLIELYRHFYEPRSDRDFLRRYLAAPLDIPDRAEKEALL